MEPGIINQLNEAKPYYYEKITIEMVEQAMTMAWKAAQEKEGRYRSFMASVFGTEEQVTKIREDIDDAVRQYLKDMK